MDNDKLRAELTEAMAHLWDAAEMFHNANLPNQRNEANSLAEQVRKLRNQFDMA